MPTSRVSTRVRARVRIIIKVRVSNLLGSG